MASKKDTKGRNLKQGEDQLKNGRYRYRYTDKFGKRHSIYSWRLIKTDRNPSEKHSSELSLREMIRKIERDEEDGISTYKANSTSVYTLLCKYLESKPQIANSTRQNYIHMIEKNIKNAKLGNMAIPNVKKSDIKYFYASLYRKKFATTTIQLYQNLLFPAFQFAVEDNLIRLNPCKDCMKMYVRKGLYSAKAPLTRKQQSELLEFVKYDTIYCKYYPLIAFMLGTGCRISETIGLTWDDIDLNKKTVSINHQILYKKVPEDNKIKYYASAPKNRTNRIIPLQKEILHIMAQYKKETFFISKSNSDYEIDGYSNFVFLNSCMKVYTPNNITRILHSIRDAYNKDKCEDNDDNLLPDFSAHTFRHTFCTRMAENGMDVKVLQEIMGHKTIAVTMQVYNHVLEDRVQNEIERVPSALIV